MLTEQAGTATELPHEALEHGYCVIIREVYERIHRSSPDQFTLACIDSLSNDVNAVFYELERLPEASFTELIEVIIRLRDARNELRLARFLFDVEEIDPVRRLILRNKAVLRGKAVLYRVLSVWTSMSDYNSSHE